MPDRLPSRLVLRPPYPGAAEAVERGCTCPILDNHRGEGFGPAHGRLWYVNADCPLHDPPEQRNST